MKYLYIPENYPDSDPAYVRVPVNGDELQRRIGKKNLIHKFSKKLSLQEIRRQAPGMIAKFIALVDEPDDDLAAARKRLFELADFAVSERLLDELEAKLIPALTARAQFQQWAAGEAETPMQPGEVAPPITKPEAPRLPLCPVETVIELWKTERHEANEPPPKPKAVRAKQGAFRRFFEHFGLADDMADPQIDRSLLQEHKEYLRTRGETVAHYDLTHMDTMYSIAERNEKVRPNPFTGFHIPGKPKGQKRSSFADVDACTIMDGVIDAEPIVRWGNWFGATLGLIIEEFSEASVRNIVIDHGIASIDIKGDLKSEFRPRLLPLHKLWLDEFLQYVAEVRREHGKDAKLFEYLPPDRDGLRNNRAQAKISRHLRDKLGIIGQTHYCWRKRVGAQLHEMTDVKDDRERYVLGHKPLDVHADFYVEHPVGKLKPIIDRIDPMNTPVEPVKEAA